MKKRILLVVLLIVAYILLHSILQIACVNLITLIIGPLEIPKSDMGYSQYNDYLYQTGLISLSSLILELLIVIAILIIYRVEKFYVRVVIVVICIFSYRIPFFATMNGRIRTLLIEQNDRHFHVIILLICLLFFIIFIYLFKGIYLKILKQNNVEHNEDLIDSL